MRSALTKQLHVEPWPLFHKKGTSIKDQVDAIIDIHAGWMTTGITKALEKYRANPDPEDKWTKAKRKKE